MMEAGVLLDLKGHPIFWHTPNDRSGGALPDSRTLWDVMWENRDRISGFAHTHPGYGKPGPSYTDITTFAAIEEALGKRLDWAIASGDKLCLCWHTTDKSMVTVGDYQVFQVEPVPDHVNERWLRELRRRSGFPV